MAPSTSGLAARVADTVIQWRQDRHPAGGRRSSGQHVALLDELTATVDAKLSSHPMPVSLRPSDGDDDSQLREHLTRVLCEEMPKDRGFEERVLNLLFGALDSAVQGSHYEPEAEPENDDWWPDVDQDLQTESRGKGIRLSDRRNSRRAKLSRGEE
jgi:hypothetical protein